MLAAMLHSVLHLLLALAGPASAQAPIATDGLGLVPPATDPVTGLPRPDIEPLPRPLPGHTCPVDAPWPGETWPDATTQAAASAPQAVAALDALLFPPETDWADPERKGVRTDGIVVVHHGRIVYERYAHGYDAAMPHLAWSVSKTFTNALTGIAVHQGRLSLDDGICTQVPAANPDACQVTVQDLLEFASGFDWKETYEHDPPTSSSVLAMLYGEGQADMAAFVAGHPLRDPPGSTYMYSSGDTNLLSAVVGRVLAPVHGEHYPWTLLFEPLGITSATWERDGAGTYVGSSYLYATPRDMARFGALWLYDGCWQGKRILPEGWVAASTRVSAPFRARPLEWTPGEAVQGRQVWLNQAVPEQGAPGLPWPDVPDDAYAAQGHWKQQIVVVPSWDLVVVRTGDDRDGSFDRNAVLAAAGALAAALQEAP